MCVLSVEGKGCRKMRLVSVWKLLALFVLLTTSQVMAYELVPSYSPWVSKDFEQKVYYINASRFEGVSKIEFTNRINLTRLQSYFDDKQSKYTLLGLYIPYIKEIKIRNDYYYFSTLIHELGHHDFHYFHSFYWQFRYCRDRNMWYNEECFEYYANNFYKNPIVYNHSISFELDNGIPIIPAFD